MEEKCQIMEELLFHSKMNSRLNLCFEARHIFNHKDMITTLSLFHTCTSSIVFINEWSLEYLTHDQKNIMVKNIKYLLEHLGGCWITPHINLLYVSYSNPLYQLHKIELSKIKCNPKGFKSIHLRMLLLQKYSFRRLGSLLNNNFSNRFSLK
jgi:hypothetical protein